MFDHARGMPTLTTPRLRLRPMTHADADDLFTVFGDPVVVRYLNRPPLPTTADARALIDRAAAEFAAGTALRIGLVLSDEDRVIGTGNLLHFDWPSQRAEVGYVLAQPHWGKGLAGEATAALIEYGFGTLGLHRLEAELDPRNDASARVLDRLGHRPAGFCPGRPPSGTLHRRRRGLRLPNHGSAPGRVAGAKSRRSQRNWAIRSTE